MTAINTQQNQKMKQKQREWEEDEQISRKLGRVAFIAGILGGTLTLLLIYLFYSALKAGAQ